MALKVLIYGFINFLKKDMIRDKLSEMSMKRVMVSALTLALVLGAVGCGEKKECRKLSIAY